MTKLFVGGFPLDITELELVQLVSPHGTVNTIKIVRDKKTGKCKGYAFLEMADKIDAENAIYALNGTMTANRALSLNIVEEVPVKPAPSRFSPRPNPGYKPSYSRPERPAAADTVKPKRPRKQF